MLASRSEFHQIRGLRHHLRRWGRAGAPPVILLHGWMDVSASFQYLVEALLEAHDCEILAPDFRGFGLSDWAPQGYWFPDYYADLDAMVDICLAEGPCSIIGHSMGAQVGSMYAGLRPERVARLVLMDGLLLPDMPASDNPRKLRGWLDQLRKPPRTRSYACFAALAERIQRHHPAVSAEQAVFIAQCWGRESADGRIQLNADPMHEWRSALLFHVEDAMAVWRQVSAPTLFLDAGKSQLAHFSSADEMQRRRHAFAQHEHQLLEACGHMMHFEQPRQTAALIAQFLQQPVPEPCAATPG